MLAFSLQNPFPFFFTLQLSKMCCILSFSCVCLSCWGTLPSHFIVFWRNTGFALLLMCPTLLSNTVLTARFAA